MNEFANKILTAMGIIADDAIAKAGYDKTIEAVVINVDNAAKGEYKISYQGQPFTARGDAEYKLNEAVHVLKSQSGAVESYRILGLVKKDEDSDAKIYQALEDDFDVFGGNVIVSQSVTSAAPSEDEDKDMTITLYQRGAANNLVTLDEEAIVRYIAATNYFIASANFTVGVLDNSKINYADDSIIDINYGLRFTFNAGAPFEMDINDMIGNVYNMNQERQVKIFQIPESIKIEYIDKIELFLSLGSCKQNFTVQIEDLRIQGLVEPKAEGVEFKVLPVTSFAFDATDTLSFAPRIRSLGLLQSLEGLTFYWFKENKLAKGTEEDSNADTNIKEARQKTNTVIGWEYLSQSKESYSEDGALASSANYSIAKSNVWFSEQDFRCAVKYDNVWYTYDFTIENKDDKSIYQVQDIINQKPSSYEAQLVASIRLNNIEVTDPKISWLGNNELLEDKKSYTLLVDTLNIENSANYTAIFYLQEEGEDYQHYLGEDSITLIQKTQTQNQLIIEGATSYLYGVDGKPLSATIPLTALKTNNQGDLIALEEGDIYWGIPINSMIWPKGLDRSLNDSDTPDKDGYVYYSGSNTFDYDIAPIFDYSKVNNTIRVRLADSADIKEISIGFSSMGAPGTNGTAFICSVYRPGAKGDTFITTDEEGLISFEASLISAQDPDTNLIEKASSITWYDIQGPNKVEITDLAGKSRFSQATGEKFSLPAIYQVQCLYEERYYYGYAFLAYGGKYVDTQCGAPYVLYSSDGHNPVYRKAPFAINSNAKVAWESTGEQLLVNEKGEISVKDTFDSSDSQMFSVMGKGSETLYPGTEDEEKVEIYVDYPVLFLYNAYEQAWINGWDGTSITTEDGSIISPRAGFGKKDTAPGSNKFTGVLLGSITTGGETKQGIFGQNEGKQTFMLDASNGSATFGITGGGQIKLKPGEEGIIESGQFKINDATDETNNGKGMRINLTNPEIRWGSGKFIVDKNGLLTAVDGIFNGAVNAEKGRIGNWWLTNGSLMNAENESSATVKLISSTTTTDKVIVAGNDAFYVRPDGFLHVGNIEATGGSIGSFKITDAGGLVITAGTENTNLLSIRNHDSTSLWGVDITTRAISIGYNSTQGKRITLYSPSEGTSPQIQMESSFGETAHLSWNGNHTGLNIQCLDKNNNFQTIYLNGSRALRATDGLESDIKVITGISYSTDGNNHYNIDISKASFKDGQLVSLTYEQTLWVRAS